MLEPQFLTRQVSTIGLVGHWKLHDGTAFDYSLQGNSGTLTGTTLTYRYPGLDLEGADEHIVVDDAVIFTPALTPLSISAWVYMHSVTTFPIASKGILWGDIEWILRTSSSLLFFQLFDASTGDSFIGRKTSALTAYQNQWIHLVGTYNGGTSETGIKLYVNGIRSDTGAGGANQGTFIAVENLAHDVWIGRYDTDYANGLVDDVMIFAKELSATEGLSIYSQTRWRYGV